jgi:hypothetical protein
MEMQSDGLPLGSRVLLQAVEEFAPQTHKIPTPDHSKKQLNNDREKP